MIAKLLFFQPIIGSKCRRIFYQHFVATEFLGKNQEGGKINDIDKLKCL